MSRLPSSEQLRVAYIVHTFEMGGLERCTAHLCNLLDRSRFDPLVVCLNRNGAASNWIRSPDVRIIEIHKRPGNDLRAVMRLARVLRENGVGLVHSQNWGTLVETMVARKWAGVRWHVHGEQGLELKDLELSGLRPWLRLRAMRWVFARIDAVVAVAEALKNRMAQHCRLSKNRIHVIPNGVTAPPVNDPAAARNRLRADLGISDGSIVVGSVGRLAPVKDFAIAVTAVSRLARKGHDVHLLLVGDGPNRASLIEQIEACQMTHRIHLVGQRVNVGDYLSAMDIYVNSSISEGTSLSILEAMASGLPLVVTDAGDNARLVGGPAPCGRVTPPKDADALGDALETLVRDAPQRASFGATAKKRHAEGFSAEHTTMLYEKLYTSLRE